MARASAEGAFFSLILFVLRDVDFRNPVVDRTRVRVRVGVRDRIMVSVRISVRVRVMIRLRVRVRVIARVRVRVRVAIRVRVNQDHWQTVSESRFGPPLHILPAHPPFPRRIGSPALALERPYRIPSIGGGGASE